MRARRCADSSFRRRLSCRRCRHVTPLCRYCHFTAPRVFSFFRRFTTPRVLRAYMRFYSCRVIAFFRDASAAVRGLRWMRLCRCAHAADSIRRHAHYAAPRRLSFMRRRRRRDCLRPRVVEVRVATRALIFLRRFRRIARRRRYSRPSPTLPAARIEFPCTARRANARQNAARRQ